MAGKHAIAVAAAAGRRRVRRKGRHLSEATRKKIAAAERGKHRVITAETRKKIAAALKGKKHPHKPGKRCHCHS